METRPAGHGRFDFLYITPVIRTVFWMSKDQMYFVQAHMEYLDAPDAESVRHRLRGHSTDEHYLQHVFVQCEGTYLSAVFFLMAPDLARAESSARALCLLDLYPEPAPPRGRLLSCTATFAPSFGPCWPGGPGAGDTGPRQHPVNELP